MKKIILIILMILCSRYCYAGIIDLTNYVSGNDVTIANLDSDNTAIEDEINGNIESVNIADGTIASEDLAEAISPVVRWDEAFSDFTYSGMLPATDTDLTSDISAGTSYVGGARINKNAESHAYTASKDTYVYIDANGYVYEEVANGASAPTTPTGSLLLAKVVTDANNITSVEDLRTTSIQITATSTNFPSHYRDRAICVYDTTTTAHATAGDIAIGTTVYTRTTNTSSKDIGTDANWIEGKDPSGDDTTCFIYAYNNSGTQWDIYYSSADPAYADTSSNTDGAKRYYTDGNVWYRAIGWFYKASSATTAYRFGNIKDQGVANHVSRENSIQNTIDDTSYGNDLSSTEVKIYTLGNPILVNFGMAMSDFDNGTYVILDVNGTDKDSTERRTGTATSTVAGLSTHWSGTTTQGTYTIKAQAKVESGNDTVEEIMMTVVEL